MDGNADASVLVVGGGIAGISAALGASRSGVAATLVTDGPLGRSNSIMAQGGIQIPSDDESDRRAMIADILDVGGEESDPIRVQRFVEDLAHTYDWLRSLGLAFDHDETGKLIRRAAGGLSSPRIVTVGDQIGRPLMKLLMSRVREECQVATDEQVTAITASDGQFEIATSNRTRRSKALIVTTGGLTYQEARATGQLTTNPPNENGVIREQLDALGLEELTPRRFQWHPFGIVRSRKGITVSCVPESVAAIGPRLLSSDESVVCPLPAPRSHVVASMMSVIESGGEVTLSLDEIGEEQLARFPKVSRYIRDYGPRPTLVPAMHYELSGYAVDLEQASALPGLFLAGEIVGGLHGQERLMGAGVADSLVHGNRAGRSAARFIKAS